MNIALIGSGGREHVLCQKIYESKLSKNIICIPGNAGTAKIAKNIDLDFLNFNKLLKTIRSHIIDLVVIGPEEPLVRGVVDFLNKNKIKVFGPNKYAAKLEGSKAFMKSICKKYKIPTASFGVFKNSLSAKSFLETCKYPIVIKANGFEDKNSDYKFSGIEKALELSDVDIRLFGKPKAWNNRRLGVILSKNSEIGQKAKNLIFINKKNNF